MTSSFRGTNSPGRSSAVIDVFISSRAAICIIIMGCIIIIIIICIIIIIIITMHTH